MKVGIRMIELLEHNKETYQKLCEVLENNNKCALVQATGTGKSYIAGKYIEEHADRALILVPTNAISDTWDEVLAGMEEKFDVVTYQAFAKEPGNYFEYDLVIADEMHHLGSDVWGRKFVDTYLQNENHKIIGLTATEIRYLDNSRDMAEEIFDNIRVDGCDLPTAINTGVLPTFKYVSALYCDESDFDEWEEKADKIKDVKVQEELKGKLDVCIKNMVSVKQAVNENLTDDYKKIIAFLNNVESKETALEMFKDVFPKANFYDVDYSKQKKANDEQISQFKADCNRAVLFAVDMLNEGVHINGTDCVIMFRKTVSPQVYLQQLGRGLASGTDKMPVIFDFVSNTENITAKFGSESGQGIIQTWNDSIEDDKKIMVKSYCLEIEELFLKISEIVSPKPWTAEEGKYIYENYKTKKISEMAKELKRNRRTIETKMINMGLLEFKPKKRWPKEEEEYIYKNYKTKSATEMAKELGRTYSSVVQKMKTMGIYEKIFRSWSKEEKLFLEISKDNMTIKEIAEKLGRSRSTVQNKLMSIYGRRMTHKKWSFEEEKFLVDNYKNMSPKEMSIVLNRTICSIRNKIRKLGSNERRKGILYTKQEDDYIKDNYYNKGIKEIAEELGRTTCSIKTRASKLGVSRHEKAIVQLNLLGEYIATYESIANAGKTLQITVDSIYSCAKKRRKTGHGYKWMYEDDYKKMLEEQKAGE